MKQKPGWVLPDLKEAQKRTTNTIDRIDTFTIPEAARMMGRGKKYFISTYGCQANERDSETLAGILDELGFTPNETAEGSDVIIINTCAIRQNAEEKEFTTAMVVHGGTIMAILSKWAMPHQDYFHWQVKNGCGYLVCLDTDEWLVEKGSLSVIEKF